MAVRLLEMHRVLKSTGSLYYHCDPTMGHFVKLLLDAIFEEKNFRNEIVWCYKGSQSPVKGKFNAKHDTLLFYGKSEASLHYFNKLHRPYSQAYIASSYRKKDAEGRLYRSHSKRADGSERRLYLDEGKGVPVVSWWDDIHSFGTATQSKERTGYPTQKPRALLERIIQASSREGDWVLDPFCGCATTCVAAEILKRRWIGIDVAEMAFKLVKMRLRKEIEKPDEIFKSGVIYRTDIPTRTDTIKRPHKKTELKRLLFGRQEGVCKGCRTAFAYRHFHIDHIVPRAKGGGDILDNLQLLCGHCNSVKGQRDMAYLRLRLKEDGIID